MKPPTRPPRRFQRPAAPLAAAALALGLAPAAHAQSFAPFSDSTHEEVRFQEASPAVSSTRSSDLRILGQLVEEALRERPDPGPDYRMGIPVLVHPQALMVQSLYLEGFGALFLARVDFPVLADSRTTPREASPAPASSPWEVARRRLLGAPSGGGMAPELPVGSSPERLRELRLRLADTLRQATNMTCLAASDAVAIRVEGRPVPGPGLLPDGTAGSMMTGGTGSGVMVISSDGRTVTRSFSLGGMGPGVDPNTGMGQMPGVSVDPTTGHPLAPTAPDVAPSPSRSTLTLRVRKSDLDALAAGQITRETFASRIESQQYSQ